MGGPERLSEMISFFLELKVLHVKVLILTNNSALKRLDKATIVELDFIRLIKVIWNGFDEKNIIAGANSGGIKSVALQKYIGRVGGKRTRQKRHKRRKTRR